MKYLILLVIFITGCCDTTAEQSKMTSSKSEAVEFAVQCTHLATFFKMPFDIHVSDGGTTYCTIKSEDVDITLPDGTTFHHQLTLTNTEVKTALKVIDHLRRIKDKEGGDE